ncbi:ornithine cyclodeaminase [Demequina sp.]|uniref:ornithine cyclodeaminase n=1 Tax=Demequina sp. TaxID=2050685 RepID=UPI003D0BAF20
MVHVVDVPRMARWIASSGAEARIAGMAAQVEADFANWEKFDKRPRVADHSPNGVIELMPTSNGELYGVKYVNGHPINPSRGLQTVVALGILSDVETGYPLLISEMTMLTALRTAATSAMAAKHLARRDARRMALIGTGSQSEFQSLGFRALLGINDLALWDTDPEALVKAERNLTGLGFDVRVASSAADATQGADIVTTCTADKTLATVLTNAMVTPGMHINAIGGDCPGKTELETSILRRARIFVEYEPQTRIEGEIQHLPEGHEVTELWRVVRREAAGRLSDEEITVFDSVGFAIEDFSALCYLRDTLDADVADVDLLVAPTNPKDLYSLVNENLPVTA